MMVMVVRSPWQDNVELEEEVVDEGVDLWGDYDIAKSTQMREMVWMGSLLEPMAHKA